MGGDHMVSEGSPERFVFRSQSSPLFPSEYVEMEGSEGSTCLSYTGLLGGLEHLNKETRLRSERFEHYLFCHTNLNTSVSRTLT